MAPRIRSGAGRPRPTSAGDRARSISERQPSASRRASRVLGANPVERHTRTPAARSSRSTPRAPGISATARRPRSARRRRRRRPWPGRPHPHRGGRRRRPPWTSPSSRARGSGPRRAGGSPARSRPRPVRPRRPTPPPRRRARWSRPCPGTPTRSDRSRGHPGGGQGVGRDGGRARHAPAAGSRHHPHRLLHLLTQAHPAVEALGIDPLPAPAHRRKRSPENASRPAPAAPRSGPR